MSRKLNRRTFLGRLSGTTLGTLAAGVVDIPSLFAATATNMNVDGMTVSEMRSRSQEAYRRRHAVALNHRNEPFPSFPTNGDESRYPNKIASFIKGLPHDEKGEVDPVAYRALLNALTVGKAPAFEAIPLGGKVKFANPQAAYAFVLEGTDPHQFALAAPPAFASAVTASEMIELYWQALTRDVPFWEYETHELTNTAAADLAKCFDFHGPKVGGTATPATLFRGTTPGDLVGPYLLQFLCLDVPHGNLILTQRGRVPIAGDDYMTTFPEWLHIQRGLLPQRSPVTDSTIRGESLELLQIVGLPARINVLDSTPRYMRNNRDLGEYVHQDFSYQAFLNAALILLGRQMPFKEGNPYTRLVTQGGFVTFGAPHLLDLVARVANAALMAAWCHKWLVHRRLRPEEFAGRVHQHVMKVTEYPIRAEVLNSAALSLIARTTGSHLLPMAYPEGCPTYPAYPAGHAAIAGACTTVLKAFFKESVIFPGPMTVSPDGLSLLPYKGPDLSVGGELNKLASNIALGRSTAGVHWRSDSSEGLKLGEAVAIGILTDLRSMYHENFSGFALTTFEGKTITI
jgi:membrane-associated phospholipid phosphatase